jgi:hypothetical protein
MTHNNQRPSRSRRAGHRLGRLSVGFQVRRPGCLFVRPVVVALQTPGQEARWCANVCVSGGCLCVEAKAQKWDMGCASAGQHLRNRRWCRGRACTGRRGTASSRAAVDAAFGSRAGSCTNRWPSRRCEARRVVLAVFAGWEAGAKWGLVSRRGHIVGPLVGAACQSAGQLAGRPGQRQMTHFKKCLNCSTLHWDHLKPRSVCLRSDMMKPSSHGQCVAPGPPR